MSEAQTAKTGVHEVAHAKLHAKEIEQETGTIKDWETKEVEAESIAYTVCQHFGIDTSDYSFGYIAGWSSGKEMPELKSSLDTIRRTSSELIKGIEAQLLEIEKERAAEQAQEDLIVLVANTDRSEYDLLSVKGMERTELFDSLLAMKDDDRQSVEACLERAGAWVTLLANERSEEVGEYHLDYAYNTDTQEITNFKELQEEREKANIPIEYGDVVVRISTPDSGEYETIKITNMQSEVANVVYSIPFLQENEWNGNVLDYLQEKGFEFDPIMRTGGVNDGYPQFYDFDVDISEWEAHTASELTATVQAEQLINRMEFHRSVYGADERNLIMNHNYKLDDMYKTTSLAHSLAEQKDDLPMLLETIKAAEEEIDFLPDGMVGLSQMHEYGYSWDEMLPLTKDRASELFGEDVSVYQLYADGSETFVEDRAETELAFRLADRYISIQEASEGYDYTIYDMDYRELDGGVYDNPDITIRQALDEIVTDLKEPTHRSELEGSIRTDDELIPIDYDGLMEKVEQAAKEHLEERIRNEVPEAMESKVIADFKAKTEELFHGINGQTQEDIERNVYAYLQSKIDEYGMDIQLVDMTVSGSRCRGLEGAGSDLDVVVEYWGGENEDALFNAFNEDGFKIGGVKVDLNPITEGKTGTLGEYLPVVEAYLEEKRAAIQEKAAEQAQMEKRTVVTLTVAECGEFHNFGERHEDIAGVEEAIAIFNQIPPERMKAIPSIGINIHTEGTENYEDTQMDMISGRTADLEILDYVPDITDNPKAVEVIAELIDKLPDIEVRGSLETWQAAFLAAEIDQLSYDYDTIQYNHTVEDREAQIANITEDIRNGNTGYLNDFLNRSFQTVSERAWRIFSGKGRSLMTARAYRPQGKQRS